MICTEKWLIQLIITKNSLDNNIMDASEISSDRNYDMTHGIE